jgi:hypothetical protein
MESIVFGIGVAIYAFRLAYDVFDKRKNGSATDATKDLTVAMQEVVHTLERMNDKLDANHKEVLYHLPSPKRSA